ncbi:hypothetical protein Lfu02_49340 [Longispora fulva]|uniref:DNRLRE domain-containing protein n=1 Tax=Longispora fulva TaxID=619741 RepID=A0A8J7GHV0_9ACTN|nr:hypothetical protein [Longispora fulva]MBG6138311.1 hypothetical protein [Longispora fulva]GIG60562.1 hypothetical protein Lfu02_49340 [Longispora fulva]
MPPSRYSVGRSWLTRLTVLAIAAAGVVAGSTGAAHADPARYTRTVTPAAWAYVDVVTPLTSHYNPTGDAPVGARSDSTGYHLTRSYFTYDLVALRGLHVFSATLVAPETTVGDCRQARHTELWVTDPISTKTTWVKRPAERERLGAPAAAEGCPASRVTWDIAARLRKAVASGADKLTLELRISDAHEGDPRMGRFVAPTSGIELSYNTPPGTPTALKVNNGDCATTSPGTYFPIYSGGLELQAKVTDTDIGSWGNITARFAVWPTDNPTQRLVRENPYANASGDYPVYITFPRETFTDGRTYAWAVQSSDGTDESAWTAPCYFTVDNTPPKPPVKTATVYTADQWPGTGGPGIPGTFTFKPNGDTDIVAYEYETFFPEQAAIRGTLPATGPGGSASVTLTPVSGGPHTLLVTAVDRAGNRSYDGPFPGYQFYVTETRPGVSSEDFRDPIKGGVGIASEFEFWSDVTGVVDYQYTLNDGAPQTVAAAPTGTTKVRVTPLHGGANVLSVRSRNAAGVFSPPRAFAFTVPTAPTVTSTDYPENTYTGGPNVPGVFTFRPKMPNVVEYLYKVGDAAEQTVAAVDGVGTVTVTPMTGGWSTMTVRSRSADGTLSDPRSYTFIVGEGSPQVSSTDYPSYQWSGYPGKPGTFTFTPNMPGVTEYRFGSDPANPQTVAAAPDGTATVSWTPTQPGWQYLYVMSFAANGAHSGWSSLNFGVNTGAPTVASTDYPTNEESGWPGKAGTFTITAGRPDVTEQAYRLDDGAWQSAPAGTGGVTTVTLTPATSGSHHVEVYSRIGDTQTPSVTYYFTVGGRPQVVSSDYPEWGWSGGPGVTGTFTFTTVLPNVTAYVYSFDGGEETTVQAGPDRMASITWTPADSTFHELVVRSRSADGTMSDPQSYYFGVN